MLDTDQTITDDSRSNNNGTPEAHGSILITTPKMPGWPDLRKYPPSRSAEVRNPVLASAFGRLPVVPDLRIHKYREYI